MTLDLIAKEGLSTKKLKLVQGTITIKVTPPTKSTKAPKDSVLTDGTAKAEAEGAGKGGGAGQGPNTAELSPAEVTAQAKATAATARTDADVAKVERGLSIP